MKKREWRGRGAAPGWPRSARSGRGPGSCGARARRDRGGDRTSQNAPLGSQRRCATGRAPRRRVEAPSRPRPWLPSGAPLGGRQSSDRPAGSSLDPTRRSSGSRDVARVELDRARVAPRARARSSTLSPSHRPSSAARATALRARRRWACGVLAPPPLLSPPSAGSAPRAGRPARAAAPAWGRSGAAHRRSRGAFGTAVTLRGASIVRALARPRRESRQAPWCDAWSRGSRPLRSVVSALARSGVLAPRAARLDSHFATASSHRIRRVACAAHCGSHGARAPGPRGGGGRPWITTPRSRGAARGGGLIFAIRCDRSFVGCVLGWTSVCRSGD